MRPAKAYVQAEDTLQQWIDDRCDLAPSAWTATALLFADWKSLRTPLASSLAARSAFTEKLSNQGFQVQRTMMARGFVGISLRCSCMYACDTCDAFPVIDVHARAHKRMNSADASHPSPTLPVTGMGVADPHEWRPEFEAWAHRECLFSDRNLGGVTAFTSRSLTGAFGIAACPALDMSSSSY